MLRNIFINLVFLVLLTTSLNAQENFMSQILMARELLENSNLDNSNKVTDFINNQPKINQGNIPTSKTPKNINSNDLRNPNISTIQIVEEKPTLSQIEQYYHLLTPESLPIYGQDAFSNQENPNLLFFNTMGRDYRLAPGDIINVVIRGLNPLDKKLQISMDGMIVLPNLQPIFVEGLNLELIEKKLLEVIQIDDFSATVNVSLNAARLVPIQITGAAQQPKTIAVPAYTPFSRVISLVGGIRKDGSFRDITLIDSSNIEISVDLYDLLRGKNTFNDPILKNATRIHINDIGLTVAITGFVGRPGIFELSNNQTKIKAKDLLELANAKMLPPGAAIEILKLNEQGIVQKQKIQNIENLVINAGEVLKITLPQTANTDRILVQGAVLDGYEINSNTKKSLAEILKYGATLADNALLDFAIIKPKPISKKPLRTVDLHYAFANPNKVLVSPGESIIILNPFLYNQILENNYNTYPIDNPEKDKDKDKDIQLLNSDQLQENEVKSQNLIKTLLELIETKRLLKTTQKIYLDNNIVALVPNLPRNSSTNIIKEQINLPDDLNLDFALKIKNFGKTNMKVVSFSPHGVFNDKSENVNLFEDDSHSNIKLFTNQYLLSLFNSNKDQLKQEVEQVRPIMIYVDSILKHVVSKNTNLQKSSAFSNLATDPNIYPFLVRAVSIKNSNEIIVPISHYGSLTTIIKPNKTLSEVEFFSRNYISQLLEDKGIDLTTVLEDDSKEQLIPFGMNQFGTNQFGTNQFGMNHSTVNKKITPADADAEHATDIEINPQHLNVIKRNSKLVSGALEKPGFYPVVGEINLENLISLAGGLLPGADLENITIREYGNNNGETNIIGTKYIDITSIHPEQVLLDGYFTVFIPHLVNNAAVGYIELEGEVSHPGKYSFSRTETLEEILTRAGGFTETAYPLGASFFRESLKNEQKVSNENLAREIERSILFLSQSQVSGAGDQINAVITYANQLKNMPASGKQILKIEGSSKKMLLQDGDKLVIPKRPSHVTISGSVQNPVTAVYNPEKSLENYISEAGGLKRIADKKNIFVLLPNGQNITLSALQKDGAVLPAGSVIIVPPKTDKLTALGLTDIWSRVLGNIATSILAINAATK